MSEPDQNLLEKAMLGQDGEDFINSDLGKSIIRMVESERFESMEELKAVSPWRRNRIKVLQNNIWRCDTFKGWMAEIVISGQQAMSVLNQQSE